MPVQRAASDYRSLLEQQGPDQLLQILRDDGLSIIDAIKLTRSMAAVDLGEAKRLVTSHAAWSDIHAANAKLHDELWELYDELKG